MGLEYEGGGEPPPRQFGLSLFVRADIQISRNILFFCFDLNVGNEVVFAWAGVQIICRDRKLRGPVHIYVVRKTDFATVKMVFDDHH